MSADEALAILENEGVELYLEGDRLRYRAAAGVYQDVHRDLVSRYRNRLIKHLGGTPPGVDEGERPNRSVDETRPHTSTLRGYGSWGKPGPWGSEVEAHAAHALALTLEQLPPGAFELRAGVKVIRPAVWLARLQADIQAGPLGPRARTGALQRDLADLWGLTRPGA